MENNERVCGTCRWHMHWEISDGWICANPDSDNNSDYMNYRDGCEEWEGRQ